MSIPKKIHVIWVGDESKRPDQSIQTWKDKHPSWEFRLWGNADLDGLSWRSKKQMENFRASNHWEGVADLMRYEILYEHGGVYVDADSVCVLPLDNLLLAPRMFAVWESEQHRPGLAANGFIGSEPRHPALRAIIRATSRMDTRVWRRAWPNPFRWKEVQPWKSVGPVFFTKMILPFCPLDVTIFPSVLFLPRHHFDKEERQSSLIYAQHAWGTTHDSY